MTEDQDPGAAPEQESVTVEPLPFADEPSTGVLSNEEYTRQLIAEHETSSLVHRTNRIKTLLDEIDAASSIPGADVRIRILTRQIRSLI